MVIDFTKVDSREQPPLILIDAMGNYAGVINNVKELKLTARYNEISQIEFSVPEYVDGVRTNLFDNIIGLSIVELKDIGRFVLVNPKDTMDGTSTTKSCSGYSLEYELTYKKITLENDTYNLYGSYWNGDSEGTSILKLIKKMVPSWSIGDVDSDLYYKYRTFEVSNENIYNFLKGTVQEAYNCIFDFDTFNRTINVRSAKYNVPARQVYLSNKNLAKEITVEEDTENIVTRLDVNGADGVDIRDVSPDGTNKITNLDYYMKTLKFDKAVKTRYDRWKGLYESNQLNYYNLSVEHALRVMERSTETAKLGKLNGELLTLESDLAVKLQSGQAEAIENASDSVSAKKTEISTQQSIIDSISDKINVLLNSMKSINSTCSFEKAFTEDGGSEAYLKAVDHYIKEDSITESSFATVEKDFASSSADSNSFSGVKTIEFTNLKDNNNAGSLSNRIRRCDSKDGQRWVYSISGGCLEIPVSINGGNRIKADIISATIETPCSYSSDGNIVFTASLGNGVIKNSGSQSYDIPFSNACITITASNNGVNLHGGSFSDDDNDGLYLFNGSTIDFKARDGFMCFTMDTNEYQQRSVSWDLFEYGKDILEKISQPSFSFSVTAANFFSIDEFEKFKNNIKLGDKIYLEVYEGKVLNPILIGVTISYNDYSSLELEFGDKYISSESAFQLADLLEQSISMGKNVDVSRFTYSAFVDSGAKTAVGEFMKNALDVSKNAILSTKDQAFIIDDAGFRLRKWADESKTEYDDHQIWMSNNCIMMTNDGWNSAKMAIGEFSYTEDGVTKTEYGVIADRIIGKLIAGNDLIIESAKKADGRNYFRVDANGVTITNCDLNVSNNNSRVSINPSYGISIFKRNGTDETKVFYADSNGNINITSNITSYSAKFQPANPSDGNQYAEVKNGSFRLGHFDKDINKVEIGFFDMANSSRGSGEPFLRTDMYHLCIVSPYKSCGIGFASGNNNGGTEFSVAIRNRFAGFGSGVFEPSYGVIVGSKTCFQNDVKVYGNIILNSGKKLQGTATKADYATEAGSATKAETADSITGGFKNCKLTGTTETGQIIATYGAGYGNVIVARNENLDTISLGFNSGLPAVKFGSSILCVDGGILKFNGTALGQSTTQTVYQTVDMPSTFGGTFTGTCTGIFEHITNNTNARPFRVQYNENRFITIGMLKLYDNAQPCINFHSKVNSINDSTSYDAYLYLDGSEGKLKCNINGTVKTLA